MCVFQVKMGMWFKSASLIWMLLRFYIEYEAPKMVNARHMVWQVNMLEFRVGESVLKQLAIMLIHDGLNILIGGNWLFSWHWTKNAKVKCYLND